MNEFLLFALVIVYMVISYRPSNVARNGQQSQLNPTASHGPRDAEDH